MKWRFLVLLSCCCSCFCWAASNCTVNSFLPNLSIPNSVPLVLETGAYWGAAFHPAMNRIVFTPHQQAASSSQTLHSINCSAAGGDHVIAESHTLSSMTMSSGAYMGAGAWHANTERLYFAPHNQASQPTWHYVDSSGKLREYAHGQPTSQQPTASAYYGAVACNPSLVFFVPLAAGLSSHWHYVNETGYIKNYTAPTNAVNNAYGGGALCPNENRIIMAPRGQALQTAWHFLDCASKNAVSFTHNVVGLVAEPYSGAVYHPPTDRVYFVPQAQSDEPFWHYHTCSNGAVSIYASRSIGNQAYILGGLIDDTNVVFAPYLHAGSPLYDTILLTGQLSTYNNSFGLIGGNFFRGGAACKIGESERFYLAPYTIPTNWYFISCTAVPKNPPLTVLPTNSPTNVPTNIPTNSPTTSPTGAPTRSPTPITDSNYPHTLQPVIPPGTVLNGAVVVNSTVSLEQHGSLVVNGDLTFTPDAVWIIDSSSRPINASGSVVLGGSIEINLGASPVASDGLTVVIVQQAQSVTGSFQSVLPKFDDLASCAVVDSSELSMTSSFSIAVTIDTDACGLDPGAIYGIVFGSIAVVMLIIGVPLAWKQHQRTRAEALRLEKLENAMQMQPLQ